MRRCTLHVDEAVLLQAAVEREWVGLRPGRKTIRLEAESIAATDSNGQQHTLRVVHNYGHGGGGISLHWGCAEDAAQLVKQSLVQSRHDSVHSKL